MKEEKSRYEKLKEIEKESMESLIINIAKHVQRQERFWSIEQLRYNKKHKWIQVPWIRIGIYVTDRRVKADIKIVKVQVRK